MVDWSSILSDRLAVNVRVVAITAATLITAFQSPRQAFALGSAQISAFLLARLIERPAAIELVLSIAALFLAPFSPAFLICPLVIAWILVRRNTTWFTSDPLLAHDVMTTIRELSSEGQLDPVAIARALLEELQRLAGVTGGTVTVGSRPIASLAVASPNQPLDPTLAQPLVLNGKEIGHITVTGVNQLNAAAEALINEAGWRLQTALLFTEARAIASAAERSRMARDMHDGVAQELTSIGYLLDDLLADAPEQIRPELRSLRNELSRVISDLRLSIFELRSSTVDSLGLGAALSDYVQQLRSTVPFKIHLTVDEGTERLSEDVEQELLRITQEALANARRHSQAENVWISCQIRAPRAQITIDDDGIGLQNSRQDSFGMSIMNERATQIDGVVTISERIGGGTTVQIDLAH